jgi:hypothetical protein
MSGTPSEFLGPLVEAMGQLPVRLREGAGDHQIFREIIRELPKNISHLPMDKSFSDKDMTGHDDPLLRVKLPDAGGKILEVRLLRSDHFFLRVMKGSSTVATDKARWADLTQKVSRLVDVAKNESVVTEKAISKGSKKFEEILRGAKRIISYNLDNQFRGEDVDPSRVQFIIDRARMIKGSKLYPGNKPGTYMLHIHSNSYYDVIM